MMPSVGKKTPGNKPYFEIGRNFGEEAALSRKQGKNGRIELAK
jgi:hypothetical protein